MVILTVLSPSDHSIGGFLEKFIVLPREISESIRAEKITKRFGVFAANNNGGGDSVRRILLLFAAVLILVMSLIGCQQNNGQEEAPTVTSDQNLQGQGVQGGGGGVGGPMGGGLGGRSQDSDIGEGM
jgi:hypothetical protein